VAGVPGSGVLGSGDVAAAQTCASVAGAAVMVYTASTPAAAHAPPLVRDLTASCARALDDVTAALASAAGAPASAVPPAVARAAGVGSDVGSAAGIASAAAGVEDLLAQTATALVPAVSDADLRATLCRIAAGAAARLACWRTAGTLLTSDGALLSGHGLAPTGLPPLARLPEAAGRAGFPASSEPTGRAVHVS
jgi:hypothetical protein